ncbi:MAG: hypothetical protein EAZ12_06410 [Sphingobacteriia bacterium]|nr:MAG: hypothetical protein EAZ12_06410 [Sphingobacteriia bacterium]
MRPILFLVFCISISSFSCKVPKQQKKVENTPASVPNVKQGVRGLVLQVTGNQMPSPNNTGQKKNAGNPYPTTVFFYEPTNINQVIRVNQGPLYNIINTKLISTVKTDSTGAFIADLPTGTYSVFVQVDKLFFANSFDIRNNISLISVEANKVAEIKIIVNNNASY